MALQAHRELSLAALVDPQREALAIQDVGIVSPSAASAAPSRARIYLFSDILLLADPRQGEGAGLAQQLRQRRQPLFAPTAWVNISTLEVGQCALPSGPLLPSAVEEGGDTLRVQGEESAVARAALGLPPRCAHT